MSDTKWQRRLDSFIKALARLNEALALPSLDEFQRDGAIQRFEFTFELGWNCLKDFLGDQGISGLDGPRPTVRAAFQAGLLADGDVWMQMIEDRNLMSHTYDKAVSDLIFEHLKSYYGKAFEELAATLNARR